MTRRAGPAAAGALLMLVGCGGQDELKQRFDPFSAVRGENLKLRDRPGRAAPRWEPIARLTGSGAATRSVAIARGAIQWRARWRCESGTLRISTAPGGPRLRERCPGSGQRISVTTGPVRVSVRASGPWRVLIEQQVDTALHEPPLTAMRSPAARLLASGAFSRVERPGRGTASLYRLPSGRLALRLQRFRTAASTGLFVWLSRSRRPRTTKQAFTSPHTEIGELKSTLGEQNYVLPRRIRARDVRSIVIWCEPVRIAYAAAALAPR